MSESFRAAIAEHLWNKLHGFSTTPAVVFAFRSVLNSTEYDSESSQSAAIYQDFVVLPVRIELTTSPLPRECSTTELRQRAGKG
jgi:hypothetical protein